MAEPTTPAFREIGGSGLNLQTGQTLAEEYLRELTGQQGVRTFLEMSNSPVVGAILFVIEQMITGVDWEIKPFSDDPQDGPPKEFVQQCLDDMSASFADTLSEVCTMFTFGWAYHEIVYKQRLGMNPPAGKPISRYDDRKIGWKKIPLRGQNTLSGWDLDDNEGIRGMIQELTYPTSQKATVPIEKSLLFRTRVERNNPEGKSLLRNAYRPWWYAKRIEEIESIGTERDLAGLPMLKPPEGLDLWNPNDPNMIRALTAAQNLVQRIRRGEKEGVILPFGWELELLASPSRRQFDTNVIITRHETRVAQSCLADFIFLGQGKTGSWALSSDKTDIFILSLSSYLRRIKEVFNRHAIPRLLKLNSMDVSRCPQLDHGDIETQNLSELAQYLSALSTAGAVLFPDEALERHLRLAAGFPPPPELDPDEIPDREPPTDPEVKEAFKRMLELREIIKGHKPKHLNGAL